MTRVAGVDSLGMRGKVERDELRRRLEEARRELARLQQEVQAKSRRDPLTGLMEIGEFMSRLTEEAGRAARYGRPLAVVRIDVDDCEALNVQYGRPAVDRVLTASADSIAASIRSHDIVCRAGADEFALLLPETDMEGAQACADRILRIFEGIDAAPVHGMSVSIGLAGHARSLSAEGLVAAAGEALESARSAGGGRVGTAGESTSDGADVHGDAALALTAALAERDAWTASHSQAVAEMAAVIAQKMGLSAEVETVRLAGLLHDVGKLAVPEAILNKPGPLDEAEWALMRDVPLAGERMLRAVPGLGGVARLVRCVHEHVDGTGYPDGHAGEQIPLGARIVAACDAYHSMTTVRPFRPVMGHERAVHELIAEAGSQFDDEVTEILIGHVNGLRQAGAWEPQTA